MKDDSKFYCRIIQNENLTTQVYRKMGHAFFGFSADTSGVAKMIFKIKYFAVLCFVNSRIVRSADKPLKDAPLYLVRASLK